jgi:hypothetical protein
MSGASGGTNGYEAGHMLSSRGRWRGRGMSYGNFSDGWLQAHGQQLRSGDEKMGRPVDEVFRHPHRGREGYEKRGGSRPFPSKQDAPNYYDPRRPALTNCDNGFKGANATSGMFHSCGRGGRGYGMYTVTRQPMHPPGYVPRYIPDQFQACC